MPILTSGSNTTLTVSAGQILTVQSDQAIFDFENPVGTRVGEYGADTVFGPFASSGSVKLSSVQGPVFYELANRPVGSSVPFDPSSVDIRGRTIGAGVTRPAAKAAGLPNYAIADARLIDSANIEGQAVSASNFNNFCVFPTVIKDYQGLPGTAGNGAIVEPSMLYFPDGWNGWEFWLAAMPYDAGSGQYENPCIFCSHDGRNWTTPAGVSNPLVLAPNANDHNYDNTLFMLEDGVTMAIAYGQSAGNNGLGAYYYITTSDGVSWSSPVAMQGTKFATTSHYLYTPCPFYDRVAKQWIMYSVDAPAPSSPGTMVYQTASSLSGPWSAPVAMTSEFPPGETAVFHIDLKCLPGNEIIGLAMTGNSSGGHIYPVRIPPVGTGFGTTMQFGPVLRACNFTGTAMYRSTAVPMGDRWFCLLGTQGVGPGGYGLVPGEVAFDSSVFFEALYARNAGLMPVAQLTGTSQAMAPYSGGLFWDSFNHATFGPCTASGNGSAAAWTTAGTGTLAISGNQLVHSVAGNSHAYVATGSADVDHQVVMTRVDFQCSATFRLQDTNNFWRVRISGSSSIKVEQVVAGVATAIAACTVNTAEANSVLRIVAKGNSIRVWWQNVLVFKLNSSYLNTQTNHGIQIGTDVTSTISNVLMALPR